MLYRVWSEDPLLHFKISTSKTSEGVEGLGQAPTGWGLGFAFGIWDLVSRVYDRGFGNPTKRQDPILVMIVMGCPC